MANKDTLLKEIYESSFAVNDLTLYLDTHPDDANALAVFQECIDRRKKAMAEYAANFEPLTVDCMANPGAVYSGVLPGMEDKTDILSGGNPPPCMDHFKWTDGPKPWGGECDHVGL